MRRDLADILTILEALRAMSERLGDEHRPLTEDVERAVVLVEEGIRVGRPE